MAMAKMDFKKLAINHVEKAVFAILALIGLLALAGAQWSPYTGSPKEITDKVAAGRQTLKNNTWPEEEREKYVISREAAPANIMNERLVKEFNPAQIEVSGKMVVDVFGGNEPVREPELLAVQAPIVGKGRVLLEILPDNPAGTTEEMAAASPLKPLAQDDNVLDEFRKGRNLGTGGMPGESGPLTYTGAPELQMMTTDSSMSSDPSAMSGDMGIAAPVRNGQGYHFVSVRGVFPVRDQINRYAQAIHKSFYAAASVFDIMDFELERQTAQAGDDPWSGQWEKVDLQVASDILSRAAGLEADVVNSMITNSVITMPLPMRISGEWRRQATHPQIEKFELSDSEIAIEVEMQRKLLEEAARQRKQMDSQVTRRKGFSDFVIDTNQLGADMMGGNMYSGMGMDMGMGSGMGGSGMGMGGGMGSRPRSNAAASPYDRLITDMARGATNKSEEEQRIRKWISARISAEGELLLFRYLDFDVEPGKTYRYRVRLVLKNPNYGRRIADAGGVPHVVEGETRLTPWSQITEPVHVDEDMRYFVMDVREQSARVLPTAKFDVFEWDASRGTFMNSPLEVRMGQRIADEVETTVIDPAKSKFETEKFRFETSDFFVDAAPEIRLDDALHEKADDGKSVKLPPGMRGKLPLSPQAMVSTETHGMIYLNSGFQKAEHQVQKSYIEQQAAQFESLKAPKIPEGGDALMELGLSAPSEMSGPPPETGKRQRNVMRAKRGRGSEGSSP